MSLEIPWSDAIGLLQSFEHLHSTRYGFVMARRSLVLATLEAEAIGGATHHLPPIEPPRLRDGPLVARARVRLFTGGTVHSAPLFDRSDLQAGDTIEGPAIIIEATGTNVVEPQWQAQVCPAGHMLLTRIQSRPREPVGTQRDPMLLEVFNNRFMSIAEEMGAVLANTAHSVNIKERLDFSCALFDEV